MTYIPKGFRKPCEEGGTNVCVAEGCFDEACTKLETREEASIVDNTSDTEETKPLGTWTFRCGMGHASQQWWPFDACPACMKKEPVWRTT